jgi:hypothetical protein
VAGLEVEHWFEQFKRSAQKLNAGQNFNAYGTSYQAGTPSYTGASGSQVTALGYEAATSRYQPGGYTASYSI